MSQATNDEIINDNRALAILTAQRMLQPNFFAAPPSPDPSTLVSQIARHNFRPSTPTECFSDEQPPFHPNSPEEESWVPIDILLGRYCHEERVIEIYQKNKNHYAQYVFHSDPSHLEFLVRIHEHAHAILHLGLAHSDDHKVIRSYPPDSRTDWYKFLTARHSLFRSIDSDTHELIAQATTWAAVKNLAPSTNTDRIQQLFLDLMNKQSPAYRLGDEVLNSQLIYLPSVFLWLHDPGTSSLSADQESTKGIVESLLKLKASDQ